jgi:hypothetical protein
VTAIDPAAGRRAKQDGMGAADAATDADWATRCDAAIEEMARRGQPLQAADLIEQQLVGEPDRSAQWGPRFLAASRAGLIAQAGAVASKRATVHSSLCRQWIGTVPARSAA